MINKRRIAAELLLNPSDDKNIIKQAAEKSGLTISEVTVLLSKIGGLSHPKDLKEEHLNY